MRLRSADATTIVRTLLVVLLAYMIIVKFSVIADITLFALIIVMDALDGFFAVHEETKGAIGFSYYLRAALGNPKAHAKVKEAKLSLSKSAPHGARFDVAGDRIVEYVPWIVFTYLHVLPLFLIFIVVIRHSFADALLGAKGTSSKMHSRIARSLYASNISRAGIQITKFVTFAYLVLVFVLSYPLWIGYVLIGILTAYILIRGVAEIFEALHS